MAITGVFNCLDHDIPLNSGAFRRIKVLLRENCAVGLPRFPHSCSVATTTLADIVCNIVQHSLSRLGRGQGMAEGNLSQPVSAAVISGRDHRKANADYINQIFLVGGGGPAGPDGDGLNYYIVPAGAGVAYRDSVESDELRFPILVRSVGLVTGSAGAGEYRGGLATRVEFSPRGNAMTVMTATNGASTVPRGARGGHDAKPAYNARSRNGQLAEVYQGYISVELAPGDVVVGIDSGGGGYGDPMDRDPLLVLEDVRESFETIERAHDIYGVYFVTDEDGMPVDIDWRATRARRATARASTA
jgi:N-methylhydantoinase B